VNGFQLIVAGLRRSSTRTVLTILSLAVGFLLFGVLQGVNAAFDHAVSRLRADRLLVQPRFGEPLLLRADAEQIERMSGVRQLTWTMFLVGTYQHPDNEVAVIMTDLPRFLAVRDEYRTAPETLEAAMKNPRAIIILDSLARQYGWKAGDRIAIQSGVGRKDGSSDWTFDVAGIMTNPSNPQSPPIAIGHYAHFDAARAANTGRIGRFVVRVDDPRNAVQVANTIDGHFINSAAPTRTLAENEVGQTALATVGEVGRLITAVIAGVLLSVLYLSGNVVLQAFRERSAELAVLKAIGFHDLSVARLIISETLLLYGIAALIGLGIAAAGYPLLSRFLPSVSLYLTASSLPLHVLLDGLLIAGALALASAIVPAWRASRLSIGDSLQRQT
jgi:putative ABC transport system permease protein